MWGKSAPTTSSRSLLKWPKEVKSPPGTCGREAGNRPQPNYPPPIRKIRELVEGKGEGELERLLGIEERAADDRERSKNQALEYLETLLSAPRGRASSSPHASA